MTNSNKVIKVILILLPSGGFSDKRGKICFYYTFFLFNWNCLHNIIFNLILNTWWCNFLWKLFPKIKWKTFPFNWYSFRKIFSVFLQIYIKLQSWKKSHIVRWKQGKSFNLINIKQIIKQIKVLTFFCCFLSNISRK